MRRDWRQPREFSSCQQWLTQPNTQLIRPAENSAADSSRVTCAPTRRWYATILTASLCGDKRQGVIKQWFLVKWKWPRLCSFYQLFAGKKRETFSVSGSRCLTGNLPLIYLPALNHVTVLGKSPAPRVTVRPRTSCKSVRPARPGSTREAQEGERGREMRRCNQRDREGDR